MSISHPWPRATENMPPAARIMQQRPVERSSRVEGSGNIMIGPWAAYFPVSLCQGCDIISTFSTSLVVLIDLLLIAFGDNADPDISEARWNNTPGEIIFVVMIAQVSTEESPVSYLLD